MRRRGLGVVEHDGVVEIEDDAARLAPQQSEEWLLKTLPLQEEQIESGKLTEEIDVLPETPRIRRHSGLDAVCLEIRQKLEHAVAACSDLSALNEKEDFHITLETG